MHLNDLEFFRSDDNIENVSSTLEWTRATFFGWGHFIFQKVDQRVLLLNSVQLFSSVHRSMAL